MKYSIKDLKQISRTQTNSDEYRLGNLYIKIKEDFSEDIFSWSVSLKGQEKSPIAEGKKKTFGSAFNKAVSVVKKTVLGFLD